MQKDCREPNPDCRENQNKDFLKHSFIDEYTAQVRKTLVILLAWGVLVIVNSYIMTRDVIIIKSFLLGFASSALYYLFMCYRVRKSADMPALKAIGYMRSGWIIRLSFILSVLIIAAKTPGIQLGAAIAGLFSLQIVITLEAVFIALAGLILRYKNK